MENGKQNPFDMLNAIGYSEKAILLLSRKLNFGAMDNPDITARHESDCGDLLMLYLKLSGEIIVNARYEYIGCRGLEAAASALTEMVKGMTVKKASQICFQDVLNYLEGIPESKHECIHLALDTLKKGIDEYCP